MYTKVLQSNDFDDLYYIDALAGSGVSTYNDGEECILGSPVIAAKAAQKPFKKMYLIENDEDKADALRSRMEYVFSNHNDAEEPEELVIKTGDSNQKIPEVVDDIWQSSEGQFNYYCFVDNQETNVKWDAIEELIPKPWGDLLINLPIASAIGRNATTSPIPESINKFYCCDLNEKNLPDSNIRPVMRGLYEDCLAQRGRPVQRTVNVDADVGSYEYDLIYATREITGGNGYIEVLDYVKQFIEDVDAGDVDNIHDVLYDDQSEIEEHLPEGDIEDEITDDSETDDGQSSLGEFCD
jgi:three-Cys-motif partner protein